MNRRYLAVPLAMVLAAAIDVPRRALSQDLAASGPQYTADGKLVRPGNYREWTYVSSGLGMNYGPVSHDTPAFTNVFVVPSAYRHYLATGQWPDKTMFVLEVYSAAFHSSINQQGSFQDKLLGVEAEVKDESRFPEKWAYFGLGVKGEAGSEFSQDECWSCHHQNGAVENTFVQFYPTLLDVAREKNTIKPSVRLGP